MSRERAWKRRGERNCWFYLRRVCAQDARGLPCSFSSLPLFLRPAASIAGERATIIIIVVQRIFRNYIERDHGRSHKRSLAKRYNLRSVPGFTSRLFAPLALAECRRDESRHKIRRRVVASAYDVSCQTLQARNYFISPRGTIGEKGPRRIDSADGSA